MDKPMMKAQQVNVIQTELAQAGVKVERKRFRVDLTTPNQSRLEGVFARYGIGCQMPSAEEAEQFGNDPREIGETAQQLLLNRALSVIAGVQTLVQTINAAKRESALTERWSRVDVFTQIGVVVHQGWVQSLKRSMTANPHIRQKMSDGNWIWTEIQKPWEGREFEGSDTENSFNPFEGLDGEVKVPTGRKTAGTIAERIGTQRGKRHG